jgi:hypothetical protein
MSRLELETIKRDKLFSDIFKYLPPTSTTAIIGKMRTGKTTFAGLFAGYIVDYYESQGDTVYFDIFPPDKLADLKYLELEINTLSKDVNVLIFDDLSFIVSGRNKHVNNFLNLITRIAHITFSDYNYIFFIGHYSKSISPFLRASNCVILTSISHPEINSLKELFTLGSLYDYLDYYTENPNRYIYLIKYHVYERIIDFTLEDLPKPRKKREKKIDLMDISHTDLEAGRVS